MSRVSNIEVWSKFKESEIWLDIKDVLEQRLRSVRDGLEQAKDYDELCRLQGASDQIRFLLTLPDLTIVNLGDEDE